MRPEENEDILQLFAVSQLKIRLFVSKLFGRHWCKFTYYKLYKNIIYFKKRNYVMNDDIFDFLVLNT